MWKKHKMNKKQNKLIKQFFFQIRKSYNILTLYMGIKELKSDSFNEWY